MSAGSSASQEVRNVRCPSLHELPSPPPGKTGWPWTEAAPQVPATRPDGQHWPRVSIVTPSFNQGRFVEETIRSVLLQGYPDVEYIIIDGGSTDESPGIIQRYERWLAYWVSEPDRGQADAINKGWARSTGQILAYINADDFYLSGAVAAAAAAFSEQPGSGMVYGTAMIVDESGEELRAWEAQPFDLRTMLAVGSVVPQPSVFFSSTALENVGHLNEEWQLIMDYDLCIRIGMQYPSVAIPETLTKFRNHPQSKTRLRFEDLADEVIRFGRALRTDQMSPRAWRTLQRATISRVRYELALAYIHDGRRAESKAAKQLLQSILLYPPFALRRPLLTAHIMKRVLVGRFKGISESSQDS
jgi:glycosyltransferase involved in cell wall biosynthesis